MKFKFRKLIEEVPSKDIIVCDNESCDFSIPNENKYLLEEVIIPMRELINAECPKCGENILTYDDYTRVVYLLRVIKFLNKWFSWLSVFTPNSKYRRYDVNTHK